MNEFRDQGESRARRYTWGLQDSQKKGMVRKGSLMGFSVNQVSMEGNAGPIFQASPESSLGHYPTNI